MFVRSVVIFITFDTISLVILRLLWWRTMAICAYRQVSEQWFYSYFLTLYYFLKFRYYLWMFRRLKSFLQVLVVFYKVLLPILYILDAFLGSFENIFVGFAIILVVDVDTIFYYSDMVFRSFHHIRQLWYWFSQVLTLCSNFFFSSFDIILGVFTFY